MANCTIRGSHGRTWTRGAVLERWRSLSQQQLRRLILASIAIHFAIASYVVATVPIVPIQPICREGEDSYRTPRRWVEGPLASAYFDAVERRFLPHMTTFSDGERVLHVTIARSLDWSDIEKQSDLAANDVLRTRLGSSAFRDLWMQRTFVPGIGRSVVMGCVTMRKLASANGEWRNRGPEPVPVE